MSRWISVVFILRMTVLVNLTGCDEERAVETEPDTTVAEVGFSIEQCPLPCEGSVASSCEGDVLLRACADGIQSCKDCSLENKKCIFDGTVGESRCALRNVVPSACIPQCEGVVCGPDNCGGSCGFCPAGGVCDAGRCWESGMPCEVEVEPLWCLGEVLASCVNEQLELLDCAKLGRDCGRNETTGKLECLVLLD